MRACSEHWTASGMFYRCYGDQSGDTALVLCHGLASNGSRWQELCNQLVLPAGWRILVPDLRGHGRSDWRGRVGNRQWLDDLAQMLDDPSIVRYVIGGHCLGANLALRYVARSSAGCLGLVLVEPMLPLALQGFMRVLSRCGGLLSGVAALIRLGNWIGIYRRVLPRLDLFELDRSTRAAMQVAGTDHPLRRRYAAPLHDLRYTHSAAYLQALRATLQALPSFATVKVPCLAFISASGLFGDPLRIRLALSQLSDVAIHELMARHWIPTEQPDALCQILSDWLSDRK
ncbi:MAG: alpha/beta hydrolase [Nitrosomonas halophila]